MMKALSYGGCATATAASRTGKVCINVLAHERVKVFPMLEPRAGAARSFGGPRRPPEALLGDIETRRAQEVERCAAKGWKSALVCLENMLNGGVSPGTRAFNIALKACAEAGEWNHAAALLRDMRACSVAPDAAVVSDVSKNVDINEVAAASGNPRGSTIAPGDLDYLPARAVFRSNRRRLLVARRGGRNVPQLMHVQNLDACFGRSAVVASLTRRSRGCRYR